MIRDNINYYEYVNYRDKYKTFTNLFKLCRLDIENIIKKNPQQRSRDVAKASSVITGLVNESWTQDDITVNVGIDSNEIFIYIEDKTGAHDASCKRSDGFQWYLSFYINFMAGTIGEYKDGILLIDNPGLLLHSLAQKDLLKTLEKLSEHNQIIFTTHSAYLINTDKLDRIRIVEKSVENGTKMKEKFYESDYDALEPIRAAIGATLGDSLFGSRENILVEGFSDKYILEGMAHYLEKIGKNTIDLSKVSIISVNGADKTCYFAMFLLKEGYKLVIVLDNDNQGRRVFKDLDNKCKIKNSKIIKIGAKGAQGKDSTIEDLIDQSFYNISVNNACAKIFERKLSKKEITIGDLDHSEIMQVNKYKKFFVNNDLGDFDKISVAKEIRNLAISKYPTDDVIGKSTTENFEALFTEINVILTKQ